MIIDIQKLKNLNEEFLIDSNLEVNNTYYEDTNIRRLENVCFKGKIKKQVDDTYSIIGNLTGKMVLPDDITLEDYNHEFNIEIDEIIDENIINNQKTLDIIEILWQNIVVEIPLKAVNKKNENLHLKGEGWRLISEDEVDISDNPFSDLEKILKDKEGE